MPQPGSACEQKEKTPRSQKGKSYPLDLCKPSHRHRGDDVSKIPTQSHTGHGHGSVARRTELSCPHLVPHVHQTTRGPQGGQTESQKDEVLHEPATYDKDA